MASTTDTSLAMSACPPLEDIAAFLDGTLSKEERDQIVAHLADCETCYDVFAGAADFQVGSDSAAEPEDEESSPPAEPKVAAFEPKRRVFRRPFARKKGLPWWRVAATAAAALVVLGIGIPVYRSSNARPELTVAGLTSPVADEQGVQGHAYGWSRYRGEGDDASELEDFDPSAFLVGALLVDLRLHAQANSVSQTDETLRSIGKQLEEDTDEMAQRFYDVANATKSAADLTRILAALPQWERELDENLLSEDLAFGKWAEAGRLAAALQDPAFFKDSKNRRFLSWLLRQEEPPTEPESRSIKQRFLDWLRGQDWASPDPKVHPALVKIQGLMDKDDLRKTDYQALKASFDGIIGHYAP